MLRSRQLSAAIVLLAVALAACVQPPTSASDTQQRGSGESRQPTLVITARAEPAVLSTKLRVGFTLAATKRLFNAYLTIEDEAERVHPYLAEALPQLHTDTWRLLPDGRMETTYRLRPGLLWQDGAPLTANDFVFAWQVYSNPGPLPIRTATPQNLMEEVTAADSRTVVIQWRRPFPDAAKLAEDFPPLPRHILEDTFQEARNDPDALANHRYWNTEFVGSGPYRLDGWEVGAFLEGSAFDAHALGRPHIDRVRVVFIEDVNAVVANLLSGVVHVFMDNRSMRFEQGKTLEQQWAGTGGGAVLMLPTGGRLTKIQFRPELASPRSILDVRVRRALAHGIDRQAINEGVFDGQGVVMDSPVSRAAPYYSEIDRAVAKYPYSPARAEQFMRDAGFSKDSEGYFSGSMEGRLRLEIWDSPGGHDEQVLAIMADGWRRVGFDVAPRVIPTAQLFQGEFRSSFPALLNSSGAESGDEQFFGRGLHSRSIPRAENRWTGSNSGNYSNAQLDRSAELFETTLDRRERDRLVIDMARLVNEDLPILTLLYDFDITAWVAALKGPRAVAHKENWNVHEWRWEA